jgi:hypothetical protein
MPGKLMRKEPLARRLSRLDYSPDAIGSLSPRPGVGLRYRDVAR